MAYRLCAVCSAPVRARDRFKARFRPIRCRTCEAPLRANTTTAVCVLYITLTVVIHVAVLWSARVGCVYPVILFIVVWVIGELTAGMVSPLVRVDAEQPRERGAHQ